MKLDEMGIVGHQVKIADSSPDHAGKVGRVVTMATDRLYVEFADGKKEWISNKHVVGTKKDSVKEVQDFDSFPLTEMAAKKQCEKCGKTMAANHYWYKGGWKCKKAAGGDAAPAADTKPAAKPEAKAASEAKPAATKSKSDPFPEMSDEHYDKLSKSAQSAQDAKEKAWYERNGRTGPKDYVPKDANDAAAHKRAVALHAELTKKK